MKIEKAGHEYLLEDKNPTYLSQRLRFANREPGSEAAGTTTQEVLRMLIDRTRYCNNCLPHPNNERIIYYLRMALVLHEARALERKTEKSEIRPEAVRVDNSGHFKLDERLTILPNETPELIEWRPEWEKLCSYELAK